MSATRIVPDGQGKARFLLSAQSTECAKLKFEGTTLKVYQEGKLAQTLSFRIDPTKDPPEIDLVHPQKK